MAGVGAGAVKFLAEKVGTALLEKLQDDVSVVVAFKEDFELIHRELIHIKFLLTDAGDNMKSQTMTNWQQSLRDVLTQAMDLIEHCDELDNSNVSSHHWIQGKIIFLRQMVSRIYSKLLLGREIQALKKSIDQINDTGSKYVTYLKSLGDVNESADQEEKVISCSRLLKNDQSVGIQNDIDVITELILQRDGPGVIVVVGTGGQGKTRVLQHVFNSKAVQNGFKHRVWLPISRKFNIDELLQVVADQIKLQGDELAIKDPTYGHEELTIQLPNDYHNKLTQVSTEGLKARIQRYLGEIHNLEQEMASPFVRLAAWISRYFGESKKPSLFVLDDVWEKNVLQQIVSVVLHCQDNQNKIVVTTRDRGVADAIGGHTHRMEYLSDQDSLELFCIHAFSKDLPVRKLPEDVKFFERLILDKCTRLPLAVEAIAKRMADVSRISHQWETALHSLDKAAVIREHVLPTLRSSYNALPYHLKACFHSFASFPPNIPIKSEYLVYAWVATFKEFLPSGKNAFDEAWSYLKQLVDRCMIQEIQVGVDDRIKYCKIQDFFHGLAQSESLNEAKCVLMPGEEIATLPVEKCKDCRRISLAKNDISKIKDTINCPDLRILLLCENSSLTSISGAFFHKLKYLAVLDLSKTGIKSLPKYVGNLKRLKVLNLSGTKIKKLPESLAGLRVLQFLDISRCEDLHTLHSGIGEHTSLLHLDMKGCKNLVLLPSGISKLRSLRTLKLKEVALNRKPAANRFKCTDFKDSSLLQCLATANAFGWTDCKHLTDMERLSLTLNRDTVLSNSFFKLNIWSKMKKMQSLSLQYESSGDGDDCCVLPPALGVLEQLESLRLQRMLVPTLTDLTFWEYHLQRLKLLVLKGDETSDGEYYRGIEKIPNLKMLRMLSNNKCVKFPKEFGQPNAFPKLEKFMIRDFNKLKKFPCLEDNAMARLKDLRIEKCSQMRHMPEGLEKLRSLKEIHLDGILLDRSNASYLEVEATWKWKARRSIKITPVEEAVPETDHECPWDLME